ncbi:type II toxin-antitoxin system HicB family antitoxin [Companilactobacillus sp. DQM5]|uniref:type II toxin-antitoxin system HicB family antitoxin n=1 Tax=Companilactobacillus sp. DQM5 TaxID=3463359 RepID=UPI004059EEE3
MKDVVMYPVILRKDDDGYIFVRIPDIDGGFTQGENEIDAIKMAEDVIGNLLENETKYPEPSNIEDIELEDGEKLVYVTTDMTIFRQMYSKKVRRNVTIPEYLNEIAKKQKINVSSVLTDALKEKIEA